MRHALVILVSVLFVASVGHAADGEGRFSIRGAGLLTCDVYTKERSALSKAYYVIAGWLDGYITARNQHSPDTYDVTSFESTELLALLLGEHCGKNPRDRLFPVVNSMFTRLQSERLRAVSPFVRVKVGEQETQIYREVVGRAQRELARRGHYRGAVDGQWSPSVQQALAGFQRGQKLQPSGFPDQATLWRLLRSGAEGK